MMYCIWNICTLVYTHTSMPGTTKEKPGPTSGAKPKSPTLPEGGAELDPFKSPAVKKQNRRRRKELLGNIGELRKDPKAAPKPKAVVLSGLNDSAKSPASYFATVVTVAKNVVYYGAIVAATVMHYFKRCAAEGPNQEEMEQIWKYLDGVLAASIACGALFVVILRGIAARNPEALDLTTAAAKRSGILTRLSDGSHSSSRVKFGLILSAVACAAAALLWGQYPAPPEFPVELTQQMETTIATEFPTGIERFGVLNESGYTPGRYPEMVQYGPNTTIVDLARTDPMIEGFFDAAGMDFAEPLTQITPEVYQDLVDRVNARGVEQIQYTRGRNFALVDPIALSNATGISWTGEGDLIVDTDILYGRYTNAIAPIASAPIASAFIRVEHPQDRYEPPTDGPSTEVAAHDPSKLQPPVGSKPWDALLESAWGSLNSGRQAVFSMSGQFTENVARVLSKVEGSLGGSEDRFRVLEEGGRRARRFYDPFTTADLVTVDTGAVLRAIRTAPAVRFAKEDPNLRSIIENRMYPTKNMAMVHLARLAHSQTNAARRFVDDINRSRREEKEAADKRIEALVEPAVDARDKRQREFYERVNESMRSTGFATVASGAIMLELANRVYWPSPTLKMTPGTQVRSPGTSVFLNMTCLPILADAWNNATVSGNEIFSDPTKFEIYQRPISRDGDIDPRFGGDAYEKARASIRKGRIVDAYSRIKTAGPEEQKRLITAVLSNSDKLELRDGMYWLRLALYERVRSDNTNVQYINAVKDSLFEIVKMGLPSVTVDGRPECCIRVLNGTCKSKEATHQESTMLFCDSLGGDNKLVACIQKSRLVVYPESRDESEQYDALYDELSRDGSSYFICFSCFENRDHIVEDFEISNVAAVDIVMNRNGGKLREAEAKLDAILKADHEAERARGGKPPTEGDVKPTETQAGGGARPVDSS